MTFTRTDNVSARVLIVESDPLMLTAMGSVLHMQGHRPALARSEEVARSALAQESFDVLVLSIDDITTGCALASKLRSSDTTRDLPIVFLIPPSPEDWTGRLANQGGVFSVTKPIDPYELIDLVDKALWMPHVAKSRLAPPKVVYSRQSDWVSLD